jgi:hypothetical protein
MATEPITLHIDEAAARVFKSASPDVQRKLEALVSLQLLEAGKPGTSLRAIMRLTSERAQERDLTPEQLEDLLDDTDDAHA